MEHADQTLHDFVLNLLSDSQALSAFEQDPAAVLDHAGLSDISAADVQEVIPLVMDYVPVHAQVLDSVLSQLPLDSVDTGQLGAIQQLQFVTQALGGLPAVDTGGTFGNSEAGGLFHLTSDGQGGVWGLGELNTPVANVAGSLTGDVEHGLNAALWAATPDGSGTTNLQLPGLDSVPGLGGLPSGFSAASDVTDALDGHLSSVTNIVENNANTASNLLTGAADLTAGALANPTDLAGALSNPAAAVSALTGVAETYAGYGTSSLPAPANEVAGQAVHTASSAVQGVVDQATGQLQSTPLGDVTSHLPVNDVTHALAPVQGVVNEVTSTLGTGGLSEVTSHLDPTHATQAVTGALSTVTNTVSGTADSVTSHSPLAGVTDSGSASANATASDHAGLVGDLGHVTDLLHLPGL
jgi:hypothetical protein